MTTGEHHELLQAPATTPAFIDRPLLARIRRGGAIGLLIGSLWALVEAALGNWDAGLAFNKFSPPGDPLDVTIAIAIILPTVVGAIGGALAPLFRTPRGAMMAGVITVVPLIAAAALFARPQNPLWQRALILAAVLAFAATMAVELRPLILKSDSDAVDGDPDRPHN